MNHKGKGYLCRWHQVTQGLFKCKQVSAPVPAAITGMDLSASGEIAGVVNAEGHTLLMDTSGLKVSYRNKKAHMVFGTDVAFSRDIDAYVSVSGDASARVTLVPKSRGGGALRTLFLLLLALLCLAYVFREHELLAPYTEQLQQSASSLLSDKISYSTGGGGEAGGMYPEDDADAPDDDEDSAHTAF